MAAATVETLGFDPVALKRKYLAERDKRLRADESAQYQQVAGDFERFADDPHARAVFGRFESRRIPMRRIF